MRRNSNLQYTYLQVVDIKLISIYRLRGLRSSSEESIHCFPRHFEVQLENRKPAIFVSIRIFGIARVPLTCCEQKICRDLAFLLTIQMNNNKMEL